MNDLAAFETAHTYAAQRASEAAAAPLELDAELALLAETLRSFAAEQIRPLAERLHRKGASIRVRIFTL